MSIYSKRSDSVYSLDKIRLKYGAGKLRDTFRDMLDNNIEKAVKLINNNISFTTLFLLQSEINKSDVFSRLSTQNKYALQITNDIILRDTLDHPPFWTDYRGEYYAPMKWILETGYIDDGLNDQFDEVISTSAVILAKVYNDKNSIRIMPQLIFKRNKKRAFIYDMVWGFFETAQPENLVMVAEQLRSPDQKDVELARRLLDFIPCISMDSQENPNKQYQSTLKWINQNKKFLQYTGESNQQTSTPARYAISLEAKYLQRPAASIHDSSVRTLAESENKNLHTFKRLDQETKLLLSNYSDILSRQSKHKWNQWLQNPIDKQIEIASRVLGGSQ